MRAVALLLTRQAIYLDGVRNGAPLHAQPVAIDGGDSSLAASLDYAISRQPIWLQDMFGATANGTSIAKLIFRRMNPDRKRPGPVTVFIGNVDFDVSIEVDGGMLGEERALRKLERCLIESVEEGHICR